MTLHLPLPTNHILAPAAALLVALAARFGGQRLGRPVAAFMAGGSGLIAGWALLQGVGLARPDLAPFAIVAMLAAGLSVKQTGKAKGRARAPACLDEAWLWLLALAGFAAWWLGGATWIGRGGAAIAVAAAIALAGDGWSVAAASFSLWAALMAVGSAGSVALVVAAACLGGGSVLPLAAGLGGAMAATMAPRPHHAALAATALAPVLCLLLIRWWGQRFVRFGKAAAALRAGAAAVVACLLAFSAAAIEGLR